MKKTLSLILLLSTCLYAGTMRAHHIRLDSADETSSPVWVIVKDAVQGDTLVQISLDSLIDGHLAIKSEPQRITGTNVDSVIVITNIQHNEFTGKTILPGVLSRDSSGHFLIRIESTTGNDDKAITISPASATDSTRAPRLDLIGNDNLTADAGYAIISTDVLTGLNVVGGSINTDGDIYAQLHGSTGHRVTISGGASYLNYIRANIDAASELHIISGAGDGIEVKPNRFDINDSLFLLYPEPMAMTDTVLIVRGDGLVGGISASSFRTGIGAPSANHGVTTNYLGKATGATTWGSSLIYDDGTDIGLNTESPLGRFDIAYGGLTMMLGADLDATTRTDNVNKHVKIGTVQYDVDEEGTSLIFSYNDVDENRIYVGGGVTTLNTATSIHFYVAINNSTLTGVEKMRVDITGIHAFDTLDLDYTTASQFLVTDANKNVVTSGYIDSSESGQPYVKHLMTPPNLYIEPKTIDGNDTGYIHIGGIGDTRGGKLVVYGNENANTGEVSIVCGNVGSVNISDSVNLFGSAVIDYLDTGRVLRLNGTKEIIHGDSLITTPCSLFTGATFRQTATAYVYLFGNKVSVSIPELTGTMTASTTTYLRFGYALPNPVGSPGEFNKPILIDDADSNTFGALTYGGSYGFDVASHSFGYFPEGVLTIYGTQIDYFTQ